MIHTKSVQSNTGFNQLSYQIFVANTEMQYGVIFLCPLGPLLQGRMRMRADLVQKMVIFLTQGQTLLKLRRPSASYQWLGVSPGNGQGTAEKVHAFRALTVQAHSVIQYMSIT